MSTLLGARGRSPLLAPVLVIAAVLALVAPAGATTHRDEAALLRLLNAARGRCGVPPLLLDRRLAGAARAHSRDMVTQRYFAHVSRSGERPSDRVPRTGWIRRRGRWRLGENLAWGRGRSARPAAVVAAWLASPVHRQVMLRHAYRVVGIGIVRGTPAAGAGRGRTYTADLGS
jgi:uncharacterized protein YkwD